jgi:hypothetical protein
LVVKFDTIIKDFIIWTSYDATTTTFSLG